MRINLWVLPLCCTLLVLSCKPEAHEHDGPYLLGSVYAIVDGHYFEGMNNSGMAGDRSLELSAEGSSDSTDPLTIRFTVGNYNGVGRYPIETTTNASITDQNTTYEAHSGYVEVASASEGHVSGTFAFSAVRDSMTRHVSAGRFELYQ